VIARKSVQAVLHAIQPVLNAVEPGLDPIEAAVNSVETDIYPAELALERGHAAFETVETLIYACKACANRRGKVGNCARKVLKLSVGHAGHYGGGSLPLYDRLVHKTEMNLSDERRALRVPARSRLIHRSNVAELGFLPRVADKSESGR
jgi:hypothetical protein